MTPVRLFPHRQRLRLGLRLRAARAAAALAWGLATGVAASSLPAWAQAAPRPPLAQRLDWRIDELQAELAILQRYAEQQRAQMDRLQARAEAAEAGRRTRTLAVLAAGALGLAGIAALPRRRKGGR
ncbi:hypothetical protein ACT80S_16510 [Ramlibacter sp. MAHUQ-53]|uniref:hypothetical protein n=1 Tax=unclassified Ramlibacter TaxID=2617605 RepID=UPI0036312633